MKKLLAVGIILLFIGMSVIPSTGTVVEKPHKAVQELTEQRIGTQILTYDPCLEIYDVYSLLFFYIV